MIRPVRLADAPAICGIYNYYIRNTCITPEEEDVTCNEMKKRIITVTRNFPWLVNEEDNEVIAYACLHHYVEHSSCRFAVAD
jgi:phosphinothricin acetyltransferase